MKQSVFNGNLRQCYGCQACVQICPSNAISLKTNSEGFWYPQIDPKVCSECNLCTSACPAEIANLTRLTMNSPLLVYAAWRKDHHKLMQSTSGGLCALIAENVISQGGVVYGCAWEKNDLRAIHTRIGHPDELDRLKHSKYVQSSACDTFREVLDDLKLNRYVLYTGTPCQIAGLKLFLGKEYENLLTIDLICHGVPSPKMFDAYIKYIERRERGRIFDFKFRDKRESGYRAYLSYRNKKNRKKYILVGLVPYFIGFWAGIFDRKSCFNCTFASPRRVGDITLGDYWGVELSHPELAKYQKYGVSVCFLNSMKAVTLQKKLTVDVEFVQSSLECAQKKNPTLIAPPGKQPPLRDQVYLDLDKYGFQYLAKKYLHPPHLWLHRIIPPQLKNLLKYLKRRAKNRVSF